MFYFYLVLSVALVPFLNNFYPVLRESYSFWLVPVIIIAAFLALVILHLAVLAISAAFVNVNASADRCAGYFRFLVKITVPLLLKLTRVKVNIKGADKIPENTRVLLVCNHQHDFDPIILLYAFPELELGFIGKKEIYKTMPLIGKVMHKLHSLPIDRENDREAVKTIIKAADILKNNKASVGLFPEGYVSKSCELLPFRNGAFKIAYRAGAPMAVCVINNTRAIPKRMFLRRTDIELSVLNVFYHESFKNMTTTELGNIISKEMQDELTVLREGKKV